MIAIQNLRQKLNRFRAVHWRGLAVGLIGIVLFLGGIYIFDLVENSSLRRTHYRTSIIYEPVLEKALSNPEAAMDLNFAPIILAIPDKVEKPVHIELHMPLLTDVKLVPSKLSFFDILIDVITRRGYNPFYIDGQSVQEFNKSI